MTDIDFKITLVDDPDGDIRSISVLRTSLAAWDDDILIDCHGKTEGLVIALSFIPSYDEERCEEKFNSLDCAQLFEHRECPDSNYTPALIVSQYAIDFGEDAEGAARLISEILQKVYSVPLTQRLEITTACGSENVDEMRRQADIRHGESSADEDDGEWPWWYYVVGGLILAAIGKILF